ncbi:MAG: hypothetical protein LKM39_06405 [Chiayiivirga sp.]|nr:hypothetical protein [Chiayiivirga sp.]
MTTDISDSAKKAFSRINSATMTISRVMGRRQQVPAGAPQEGFGAPLCHKRPERSVGVPAGACAATACPGRERLDETRLRAIMHA